jgi:biopolymer transport protein TolR
MDVRRKRRLASEINVVPYIDVMLVLVVIFMATATIALGVQVDLPEAQAQPLETPESKPIELTVRRDGALLLNIGPDPTRPISREEAKRIVSVAIRYQPGRQVVVSGDHRVGYGAIMDAMVLLQEAGAQKVGLQSRPPPS